MLEIKIDTESCSGSGYCARVAPELFVVIDDKSTLRPDIDARSVDAARGRAAAAACPWRAIEISETGSATKQR